MNICPECDSETLNEYGSCAGAEAEEKAQNVNLAIQGTNGLISCYCCDKCREICIKSWENENISIN